MPYNAIQCHTYSCMAVQQSTTEYNRVHSLCNLYFKPRVKVPLCSGIEASQENKRSGKTSKMHLQIQESSWESSFIPVDHVMPKKIDTREHLTKQIVTSLSAATCNCYECYQRSSVQPLTQTIPVS